MCAPSSGAGGAGPPPPWFDPEGRAVAPGGKTKAVATPGGTIQFQDVATGRREEFRGPPEPVTALVFGPDGGETAGMEFGPFRLVETIGRHDWRRYHNLRPDTGRTPTPQENERSGCCVRDALGGLPAPETTIWARWATKIGLIDA